MAVGHFESHNNYVLHFTPKHSQNTPKNIIQYQPVYFLTNISMIFEFAKEFDYIMWPHFLWLSQNFNKQKMYFDLHQHQKKTFPQKITTRKKPPASWAPFQNFPPEGLRVDKIQEVFTSTKLLGGWTNPFEKTSQNGNLPHRGVKNKHVLKPPPTDRFVGFFSWSRRFF